jgi:hypothetical protein
MTEQKNFDFLIHTKQMKCAVVSLVCLIIILAVSIITLIKKKETVNLRGQTLLFMMIFMHTISLGYPNILTLLAYHEWYYFPSFHYFNVSLDIFACIMITLLIFIRAIFMYQKSNNKVVSNLRGVILTVALYVGSIYVFSILCFRPNLPLPDFQVYQIDRSFMLYIPINVRFISVALFFFLSFILVKGLVKWGVYYEMMFLVILVFTSMFFKGFIKMIDETDFFFTELQSNLYRIFLMMSNCFVFIIFFDEMQNPCEINTNMDILKATNWQETLVTCFEKFLKWRDDQQMLDFFRSDIKNNNNVWQLLHNFEGNYN